MREINHLLAVICVALATMIGFTLTGALGSAANQPQMKVPENADYSKFQHTSAYHARLPCLLCHRRETNSPQPKLPGSNSHLPCAGCHAQQFANAASPICTICHTDAQSGKLKAFPRLSGFGLKFDHARHLEMGSVSCRTCHSPARSGVSMRIPVGFSAHVTCYRCHGPQSKSGDRDISSCGVCHVPGPYARPHETAAAFRVGFSHAKHEGREKLSCTGCHRVRAGVSLWVQVSAPEPLNHHASPKAFSCMSCHDGKRTFGGDDFSVCKRCHQGTTWHF